MINSLERLSDPDRMKTMCVVQPVSHTRSAVCCIGCVGVWACVLVLVVVLLPGDEEADAVSAQDGVQ